MALVHTGYSFLQNAGGTSQDTDGGIILGKIRFRRAGDGEATITISVIEIPGFDSFVGFTLWNCLR